MKHHRIATYRRYRIKNCLIGVGYIFLINISRPLKKLKNGESPGSPHFYRSLFPFIFGAHFCHPFDRYDEDLSIADLSRPAACADRSDDDIDFLVFYHQLDLDLRYDVDLDLFTPVFQDDAFLFAPAHDLDNGHGDEAFFLQGFFNDVQPFRPDYCLYHLHTHTSTVRPLPMLGDIQAYVFLLFLDPQADRHVDHLGDDEGDDYRIQDRRHDGGKLMDDQARIAFDQPGIAVNGHRRKDPGREYSPYSADAMDGPAVTAFIPSFLDPEDQCDITDKRRHNADHDGRNGPDV